MEAQSFIREKKNRHSLHVLQTAGNASLTYMGRSYLSKGVVPYMWCGSRTFAVRKQRSNGNGKNQAHRNTNDLLGAIMDFFFTAPSRSKKILQHCHMPNCQRGIRPWYFLRS